MIYFLCQVGKVTVPRYLVRYGHDSYFQMRLTFTLVDEVKQITLCGPHPVN